MTKTNDLSRRKLLGRIGLLAAAGYTVPALTTLSVAQAGSGASGGGNNGGSSSGASGGTGGTTGGTGTGTGTAAPTAATIQAACGPENLNDPAYLQCLVTNGF